MLTKRKVINPDSPICWPRPRAGIGVSFTLCGADGLPCMVWDAISHQFIGGTTYASTDGNGVYHWFDSVGLPQDVELWINARGLKNTKYLCHVDAPGAADFFGVVPSGDEPLTWIEFATGDTSFVPAELQHLYVQHSLAQAANDFLVASGVGLFVKKTLAEIKTILGLGTAAYTDSTAYDAAGAAAANVSAHLAAYAHGDIAHANRTALDAVSGVNTGDQTLSGLGAEAVANKATSFAVVNDTLYPSVQSVKTYVDGMVVGLLDDRGTYDASGNVFPSSGGSGAAGAILKGDLWYISIAGVLGGVAVNVGDSVRALTDSPAQTAANWSLLNSNIGYVPENVVNKDTDGTFAANSDTKYPSQKAVKTYADTKLGLYWQEFVYNTGVNATIHAVRFMANSSSGSVDAILSPKGSGAILAQVPDGTATGGNKRGMYAFDMQRSRTAASQVASGQGSAQFGENNTTSGTDSFAAGFLNASSGNYTAMFGYNNSVSASFCFVVGANNVVGSGGAYSVLLGYYNSASAYYAFAAGRNNVANGEASAAIGYSCNASGIGSVAAGMFCMALSQSSVALGNSGYSIVVGKVAYGAGTWGASGDAQGGLLALRGATTTNASVVLTSNGSAAGASNQLAVAINQATVFEGRIIAKQQGSANIAAYKVEGRMVNNGGTVTVDGVTLAAIGADTIGLDVAPTFAADNTNKTLAVTSGYKATTNIRWVCNLWSTEVIYT